jgi:hypothetical protein
MSITLTPIVAKPIKLKNSGSFINWIESHNQTLPEVGKGATQYHWSDRTAYFVNEVSNDYKRVTIERAKPIYAEGTCIYTSEAYPIDYARTGDTMDIVFRYGGWHIESIDMRLKKNIYKMLEAAIRNETYAQLCEILKTPDGKWKPHVVEPKKTYSKINIGFGVMNAYYDPTF